MRSWPKLVLAGLAGGVVINAIEWVAHKMLLDPEWTRAFAAFGKAPMGWTTFIAANFLVPVVAVWLYEWLTRVYARGAGTAIRTAIIIWIVFWVIPILGLQPMNLFPNYLLTLVIAVGVLDGLLGTLPAIWIYEKMAGHAAY